MNKQCFPGPSYLKLIVLVIQSFFVPARAIQTLSPLTSPQWQGPGGQTIAALHSAHSWVASGRTTACFVCWFWLPIRETPQSLHGECRTLCQDHCASLEWLWKRHTTVQQVWEMCNSPKVPIRDHDIDTDAGGPSKSLTWFLRVVSLTLFLIVGKQNKSW